MNKESIQSKQGHDAACRTRDEDHLNRWPLAVEIYRIAADGPKEWSVRVGIYGEWGSGKSSVLNFIGIMASKDGHVVFYFNPWQYHSANELWRGFVDGLFSRIEEASGQSAPGRVSRSMKIAGSKFSSVIPKIVSLWREDAGNAAETGLEFLKRFLCFSAEDLEELNSALKGKRLLVCIDDLDRTDSQLVPDILYALKEIMDVPGIAFICAFDPVVVGKVLGSAHPGYGDGLKFLDKIIDYPRWLPAPKSEQLANLAVSDAATICPYVPSDSVREIIAQLPPNPRSIRQFIRLLDLLRPQIDRHHPHELHWPLILTANVIKVLYPRCAHQILEDRPFWERVYHTTFFDEKKEEEQKATILKKIEGVVAQFEDLSAIKDSSKLGECVTAIAKRLSAWMGVGPEELQYQFHIAEAPRAVTCKEFDEFICCLNDSPAAQRIVSWIEPHGERVGHPQERIFSELVYFCLNARKSELGKAADETSERNVVPFLRKASNLLKIVEIMALELADKASDKRFCLDPAHIKGIFDNLSHYFHWRRTPGYRAARKAEERFLRALFSSLNDSIHPWLNVIGLNAFRVHSESSIEWKNLMSEFRSHLSVRCAEWLISQLSSRSDFRRTVFHHHENGYQFRELFLDLNGPVWTSQRKRLLKVFSSKSGNTILQSNAYELLSWLVFLLGQSPDEAQKARSILSQTDFSRKLWKACVAQQLNPRAIGSLREAHDYLVTNGIDCKTPAWWDRIVKELPPLKS